MKLNFSGIILFVNSVDTLKSFYVDVLQLQVLEEIPSEWLLLQAGHCNLGLHKIGQQYASDVEKGQFESNTKILFDTDEDIFSLRDKLILQRIKLNEVKTFPDYDYWLCDGEDPEGNVFQLRQKKSPGSNTR